MANIWPLLIGLTLHSDSGRNTLLPGPHLSTILLIVPTLQIILSDAGFVGWAYVGILKSTVDVILSTAR
jgi:hypothetical protein